MLSKRAPIPITRYALAEAFGGALILLLKNARNSRSGFAADCGCLGSFVLLITLRGLAVGAAVSGKLPGAVVDPAVLTGAAPCALWVVVGILIERDAIEGMQVAEYVTASSAVVPPSEVGEEPGANGLIAYR